MTHKESLHFGRWSLEVTASSKSAWATWEDPDSPTAKQKNIKKNPIMREMCLRCLLKWSRWLHAYECFAWMKVCAPPGTHGGQKRRSEEGPRITNSCALPCGCREPNLGPLQEQQVPLTSEPSVQSLHSFSKQIKFQSFTVPAPLGKLG